MANSIRRRFIRRSNTEIVLPQTIKDKDVLPSAPATAKRTRIFGLPKRVLSWLYSTSLGLFLLIFIAFNTVLPIDVIIQSKDNLALNTLVVMICCVTFIVVCLIVYSIRVFVLRLGLQDIPKFYIPDHYNDFPLSCYNYIEQNFQKCQEIITRAQPNQDIKHPGLYHSHTSEDTEPNGLPHLLVYEDVLRAFGEIVRKNAFLFKNKSVAIGPKNATYAEMMNYFLQNELLLLDAIHLPKFLALYERIRFSGEPITEGDFFDLMALFIKSMNFMDSSSNNRQVSSHSFTNLTKTMPLQSHAKRKSWALSPLSKVSTNNSILIRYPTGGRSIISDKSSVLQAEIYAEQPNSSYSVDTIQNRSSVGNATESASRLRFFKKRTSSKTKNHDSNNKFEFPEFQHAKPRGLSDDDLSSVSTSHSSVSRTGDDDFYTHSRLIRYRNDNYEAASVASSGAASNNTTKLYI